MKCCDITPGKLNRKIAINRRQLTPDNIGGFDQALVNLANPWAMIKPKSGTELLHADKLDAKAMSEFTIRYRTDLVESDLIEYRGVEYNIRSIINIEEADKYLLILAERGVAQ